MWPSKGNSVCLRKKKPLKSRGGKSRKPCATSKKKKRKRSERREKRSKRRRKSDLRSSMNKLKDRGNVSKKSLKNKIALDRRVLELVVEPGSPGEQRQKKTEEPGSRPGGNWRSRASQDQPSASSEGGGGWRSRSQQKQQEQEQPKAGGGAWKSRHQSERQGSDEGGWRTVGDKKRNDWGNKGNSGSGSNSRRW
mmetsp:Transcript_18843/g.29547  ORF Transcript_18843/g.29547 Transcript_18843/m.29547 type:complete len:194 (+) Transcript_18843:2219-2800(+)